ncbi:DnaJ domain [Dillenia turbinata]|uniref:DnaJ domain n=1 Tax=Dillenia turbinata TaxID=194707 RepID=A0AAN8ZE19_9MAGN
MFGATTTLNSATSTFSFLAVGSARRMPSSSKTFPNPPIRAAVCAVETRKPAASLYDVLRVNRNASLTEIKTAYRSLAKLYHPDAASESDGRDFIEIHNAYATLSDPAARAVYDLSLGSTRRRSNGRYSSATPGFYSTTRRWETDQCW